MAKSTVNNILPKMKRMYDYNISDTDLDTLLIDFINDSLKILYQKLVNKGLYWETATSVELSTTAAQEYITISSTLAAADDIYRLSEETNDTVLLRVPMSTYRELNPDPSSDQSNTATHYAIQSERLYLYPTPSTTAIKYLCDYTAIPTDVSAGDTLPYKTKYDPIIIALSRLLYLQWFDHNNVTAISAADAVAKNFIDTLITSASTKYGQMDASQRRTEMEFPRPQAPANYTGS